LDELLCHDSHSDTLGPDLCTFCWSASGTVKCQDCFGSLLQCHACIVKAHRDLPLHQIEVCVMNRHWMQLLISPQTWNSSFFNKNTLSNLGLQVQLGHGGGICPYAPSSLTRIIVLDISGVHNVSVDFCNCLQDGLTPKYMLDGFL
jgi:hypothetical protein